VFPSWAIIGKIVLLAGLDVAGTADWADEAK
jgi:hypothetical protein